MTSSRYLDALAIFTLAVVAAVLIPAIATSIRSAPGRPALPEHPDRAGRRRTHQGASPARRRHQVPPS